MPIKSFISLASMSSIVISACAVMPTQSVPYFATSPATPPQVVLATAPTIAPTVEETRLTLAAKANTKDAHKSHDGPRPYIETRNASADVDATLFAARIQEKNAMIVMGANWCHDSRALAGEFQTQRFQSLISTEYELVYVDVGQKNRNIDIAKRFGLDTIEGTPTVFIIDPDGSVLNLDSAPTWRHAASMESDDIYRYFKDFAKAARELE